VGPRADADGIGKNLTPARTIQPVASCNMTALSQAHNIVSFVENCLVRAVLLL